MSTIHKITRDDPTPVPQWAKDAAEEITEIDGICIGGDYHDRTASAVNADKLAAIIARHAPAIAIAACAEELYTVAQNTVNKAYFTAILTRHLSPANAAQGKET